MSCFSRCLYIELHGRANPSIVQVINSPAVDQNALMTTADSNKATPRAPTNAHQIQARSKRLFAWLPLMIMGAIFITPAAGTNELLSAALGPAKICTRSEAGSHLFVLSCSQCRREGKGAITHVIDLLYLLYLLNYHFTTN